MAASESAESDPRLTDGATILGGFRAPRGLRGFGFGRAERRLKDASSAGLCMKRGGVQRGSLGIQALEVMGVPPTRGLGF